MNSRNNSMNLKTYIGGAVALFCLMGLAGCRNPETDNNVDAAAMSSTSQGSTGTGVGVSGIQTKGDAPTGSSTQRTGTGYTGPVGTPGPGQAGR